MILFSDVFAVRHWFISDVLDWVMELELSICSTLISGIVRQERELGWMQGIVVRE